MKRQKSLFLLALLPLAAGLVLAGSQPPRASVPLLAAGHRPPAPTENRLDPDAEQRNKAGRLKWLEDMHRAAPGVDWRAIEEQNGRAAMGRRSRLLQNPAAAAQAPLWRELGSRNQAGRMMEAVRSSNGTGLFAGAAVGGLWQGGLDGSNWTPLGDNLYGGAAEVAAVPDPQGGPDILLIQQSQEIWRSTDLGVNWAQPAGLTNFNEMGTLVTLEDAGRTILLLARKSGGARPWKLLRSSDQGATFNVVHDLGGFRGDVWAWRQAAGGSRVFLLDGNGVWESLDSGQSFNRVGNPLPVSGTEGRLRGQENGAPILNAVLKSGSAWKLYRSADLAGTWVFQQDLSDFWGRIEASIHDPLLLAYGGVEVHVSRDGGASFTVVNNWWEYYGDPAGKLHADIMGMSVADDPGAAAGEVWYIGTDGGLFESRDGLQSVQNLSLTGLGVSQYYDTFTSRRDPDLLLAGSQDQGYQRAVLGTPGQGGGPWADFDQLISGDYGHMVSGDGSHDLLYCTYPGFILAQDGERNPSLYTADFPSGSSHLWLPPVVADPTDKAAFFFLGRFLYRYATPFPNLHNWTPTQFSNQDFGPGQLSALAFSPLDPSRAWAATTDGKLFYSRDGGVTWTLSGSGPPSHYFYGTALLPSSLDVDTVYVGGSGYSNPPVKVTHDGGVSWSAMRSGLPSTLIYDLCESPDGSGAVFAAAETGAWRYDPATGVWSDILGTTAPITLYWSVEAVPSRNIVRFGSYARGIWDYEQDTPGYFPYGELLGGANKLRLRADGPPRIGNANLLTVESAPSGARGILGVSQAAAERPFRGGTLLLNRSSATRIKFTVGPTGSATIHLPIPNLPALVGQERFLQAAVADPAQPQGWALSQGLRAVIGD